MSADTEPTVPAKSSQFHRDYDPQDFDGAVPLRFDYQLPLRAWW